jgi:sec-independent protein translocase protein TatA
MGIFDVKHWAVILVVVLLVFGTKKVKNLGSDLGESIKGFRRAMSDDENESASLKKVGEENTAVNSAFSFSDGKPEK